MDSFENDKFAILLGFEVLESRNGKSRVRAKVKDDYLNGVGITHGGFLYTLADFALAAATNTGGRIALNSTATINYLQPCPAGAVIIADASYEFENGKTALCIIRISNEKTGELYCVFESRAVMKKV